MAYVIAFANQKGGVGKTTSVLNTAAALGARGLRVCQIDLDPQASLTRSLRAVDAGAVLVEDLLLSQAAPATQAALVDVQPGVSLLGTSSRLAEAGTAFPMHPAYGEGLGRLLAPIEDGFEVILIDTPPGLNEWSGQALLAADGVVIPVRPNDMDVAGAADAYDFVEGAVRAGNPPVEVLGVLITQTFRQRRRLRETREALTREEMRHFETWIPMQESVGEAMRHVSPTLVREPASRVAHAYREFAEELLAAIRSTQAGA
jgi:chromosome partitioning protein